MLPIERRRIDLAHLNPLRYIPLPGLHGLAGLGDGTRVVHPAVRLLAAAVIRVGLLLSA